MSTATAHGDRQSRATSHPQQLFFLLQDISDTFFFFLDGDLGVHGNARTCLMKQKHRMMEERKKQADASQ